MDIFQSPKTNYYFKYNIEKVYRAFISYNTTILLKRKGLIRFIDYCPEKLNSTSEKEILLTVPETYIIQKTPIGEVRSLVEEKKNEESFKSFVFTFKAVQENPIDYYFQLVFNFYCISETNSTIGSFYLRCSKSKTNEANIFQKCFPESRITEVCKAYEKYLDQWVKPDIFMDSTLINSKMSTIFQEIISGRLFLKLSFLKGFNLVVKRKDSLVGSSYIYTKNKTKVIFVIKSIEENSNYFNIVWKKKEGSFFSKIQTIVFKIEEKISVMQCNYKCVSSMDCYYHGLLRDMTEKTILETKRYFENTES